MSVSGCSAGGSFASGSRVRRKPLAFSTLFWGKSRQSTLPVALVHQVYLA